MPRRDAKKIQHRDEVDEPVEIEGRVTAEREHEPDYGNRRPEDRAGVALQDQCDKREREGGESDIADVLRVKGWPDVGRAKQKAIAAAEKVGREKRRDKSARHAERTKEIVGRVRAQTMAEQFQRRRDLHRRENQAGSDKQQRPEIGARPAISPHHDRIGRGDEQSVDKRLLMTGKTLERDDEREKKATAAIAGLSISVNRPQQPRQEDGGVDDISVADLTDQESAGLPDQTR